MLKRATVSYLGGSWLVDLPSSEQQPGTWAPITAKMITPDGVLPAADPQAVLALGPSCVVAIPDGTPLTDQGQIDTQAMALLYPGTRYASPAWVPPVLSAP